MADIAKVAADLTPQWFMQTLGQHPMLNGRAVKDVHTETVGTGQMGHVVRATLSLDGPGEPLLSFVVKMASTNADSLRMCQALNIYESEVRFYQEIAPHITMRIPACHFAGFDAASGMFTLVMEDASAFAKPGDALVGGTVDQAALSINALAGLHAPLWNPKPLQQQAWLDHQRTVRLFSSLPAGMDLFLDRFGHGFTTEQVALIQRVVPNAKYWAEQWRSPTVVVHGDYRLDNMLFGTTPDAPPLIVIDWQSVCLGPPMVDAAYCLGAGLSTKDRRANERHLIREYHERLVSAGVEDFDFNACWNNYRQFSLYGLIMNVGISAGVQQTERGDAMLLATVTRHADVALDLEAAEFMPR